MSVLIWAVLAVPIVELATLALTAGCIVVMAFGGGARLWWGDVMGQLWDIVEPDPDADARTLARLARAAGVPRLLTWPLGAAAFLNAALAAIYPRPVLVRRQRALDFIAANWVPVLIADRLGVDCRHMLDAWRSRPSRRRSSAGSPREEAVSNPEHWSLIFGGIRPGDARLN